MHLKNFSLIRQPGQGVVLFAAYDLVATALVYPADDEDLGLTLNGKKKKIQKPDFEAAFNTAKPDARQQQNIFTKMRKSKSKWMEQIDISFPDKDLKENYKALLENRFNRLS